MPWFKDKNGNPVWREDSGPRVIPIGPQNPYAMPKAEADLQGANLGNTQTAVQTKGNALDNETKARTIRQNPINEIDQRFLSDLRKQNSKLGEALGQVERANAANNRFNPFPGKGDEFEWFTPDDSDWPLTSLLKRANYSLNPFITATQQEREDYQELKKLQNLEVLAKQQQQTGPQTDSDKATIAITGITTNNDRTVNNKALREQELDFRLSRERENFYTFWANQFGSLSALNNKKQSVGQAWAQQEEQARRQLRNDPSYIRATSPQDAVSKDEQQKFERTMAAEIEKARRENPNWTARQMREFERTIKREGFKNLAAFGRAQARERLKSAPRTNTGWKIEEVK